MPRFFPIKIELDGKTRRGDWCILQGYRVCVRCLGYPSDCADIGNAKPEAVAAKTLAKIIRAGEKKRVAELKERERARAAVQRYWDKQKLGKPKPPRTPTTSA